MYIYLLFDDTSKSNPTSVRAGFIGTMWGYLTGLTRPDIYVYDHHSQLAAGTQLPRTFAACQISPSRCH